MLLTKYNTSGTTAWTATFGVNTGGDVYVGAMTFDASGNILITGSAYNGTTNNNDLFVVKYNASGTQLWYQLHNGPANTYDFGAAVACDATGDVYVTGGAFQTVLNPNVVTIRYNSSGTAQWTQTCDNVSLFDAGGNIAFSASTMVTIMGFTQVNATTWEYVALNYLRTTGQLQSYNVTNLGGTSIDRVNSVTFDNSGNTYITGTLGASGQGLNIKTVKFGTTLNILWTANWNGAANLDDVANAIAVDAAGTVYVAGYTTTATGRDAILLSYNSGGSATTALNYDSGGDDAYQSLGLTSDGGLFAAGYASPKGNKDCFAAFYLNGSLRWKETYNGYANGHDEIKALNSDGADGFYADGPSEQQGATTTNQTIRYARHSLLVPLNEGVNAPFVENRGQLLDTDDRPADGVRYYTRSNYPNVYILDDRASFAFAHIDTVASTQDTMTRLDLTFGNHSSGGGATIAVGLEQQEDFHNYYLGHIPEGRERVPLENKVLHPNIYTNIDALYGLGQDGFFMRFICKPGSTPSQISMRFTGQSAISIQTDGSLRVETALEDLILAKPTALYSDASGMESTPSWTPAFVLNTDGSVGLTLGTVPGGSDLIVKTGRYRYYYENECDYYWSTYFGHAGNEKVKGSDVDANGFMYFTGHTNSAMFPTTTGAYSQLLLGSRDAFAACFRQLDEQEWATFYGGTEVAPTGTLTGDDALAIKWNPSNDHIYFTGRTPAADFPLKQATGYFNNQTPGVWSSKGFIVKLTAENGVRSWATFFGDPEKRYDAVTALHIRENGNVVVGGYSHQGSNQTAFPFFPPNNIPSAIPHIQTQGGLYIAEFDPSNAQVWATKLTNELELGNSPVLADIAEGIDKRLFVVGNIPEDGANDFIPTGSGSMAFSGSGPDVFLMEFSQAKELVWSTYLGGNDFDIANSVVSTLYGTFVTGTTQSSNFPVVVSGNPGDPFLNDLSLDGLSDIFVSQFQNDDNGGNILSWSRYLGGSGGPSGFDMQATISHNGGDDGSVGNATVVLSQNEIAITGMVSDAFSPLTPSGCPYYYGSINRGVGQSGLDAILVIIKFRGITFSTYWGGEKPGGSGADEGTTISKGVNPNGKAFVLFGGSTDSKKIAGQGETIPVCRELPFAGSYYNENFLGGSTDAFISKIYYGECLVSGVTSPWDETLTLDIQPNPATDFISITLPVLGKDGANILLFDPTGKVVANISPVSNPAIESPIGVDIGSFQSGMYYITLQSSGRIYSGKFLKI